MTESDPEAAADATASPDADAPSRPPRARHRPVEHQHAILERNLELWPLMNLSRSKELFEYVIDEPNGDRVVIGTSSPRGLPGPIAQDLYMALGYLLNEAMGRNAAQYPPNRKVTTTFQDLVSLCQIERGGRQYELIRDALDDLFAVHITGTHVFKGGRKMRSRVEKFHIIDHVEYGTEAEEDVPRGSESAGTVVTITFNDRILENMVDEDSRWFRVMGLGTYFKLEVPTAKRLFRYLDAKRYRGTTPMPTLALSLRDLKDHLPVLTDAPTHIKRTLDRAHDELVKAGILAEMPLIEKSAPGRGAENWLVRYTFATDGTYADAVRGGPKKLVAGKPPVAVVREEDQPNYLSEKVAEMILVLGGEGNAAWYAKIAKTITADRLRGLLSEIRQEQREGGWTAEVLRMTFSKRAIAAADDQGKDLSRDS